MELLKRIKDKNVSVAVIGMGYVGLPLMLRMAESGFKVTGIDLDINKVNAINSGNSYIEYITHEQIKYLVDSCRLSAQSNDDSLEKFDVLIICVPTPIDINKEPDLKYINSAVEMVAGHLRNGQIIILESTTFPGTTGEIVLPVLSRTGMRVGKDFFLGFSPERVDPGNKRYGIKNTPKIVSGVTEDCTDLIYTFYSQFIDNVYRVSCTKTAEMVKILENTFRSVNIALVNQLSLLCHKMEIDIWEVIEAASTKPFGFMPFYPGPGVGGHCIPVDPLYLSWKAKEYDFLLSLVEIADNINSNMPYVVIDRIEDILNNVNKPLSYSKIMLLGVSYKQDIGDTRESPALKIIKLLQQKNCQVIYHDPYIGEVDIDNHKYFSQQLSGQLLSSCDCTVLLTPHSNYDYEWIVKNSNIFFDTRNATNQLKKYKSKIIKL
ncbi:nucleotide sugar dehydrogenase [Petroclostridium xylanilyticum]|uniref:nucleotide sugar dehydrogenase n=1 Tax=Petroclostridium xylanilyticum TaxID=1792311 RepID=UPI000B995C58|nr:nucleotide sugar dehydrogenase [Petroclostridium xylanilyticum]